MKESRQLFKHSHRSYDNWVCFSSLLFFFGYKEALVTKWSDVLHIKFLEA